MDRKEKQCRVCLSPTGGGANSSSLFDEYRNSSILNYINTIANVEIKEGDGFPTNICKSCFVQFEIAVDFRETCRLSNETLLSLNAQNNMRFIDNGPEVFIKNEHVYDESTNTHTSFVEEIKIKDDGMDFSMEPLKYEDDTAADNLSENALNIEDKLDIKIDKSRAIDLKLECHDCGNLFKSKCKLRVHWKKVHLPQALVCPNCKRTFHRFKSFNNHRRNPPQNCVGTQYVHIEGQGRSRIFYCKECSFKTSSPSASRTHSVVHSGEKRYQCNYCSKQFSQCSSLLGHKEMVHKEIRVQITCQYCGKHVTGRSSVYRHLKSHTDNHHQCPLCQKILVSKKSLAMHLKRHKGDKDSTCHVCASSFYTASELVMHMRKKHGGSITYSCEMCNYKTTEKYMLKRHIKKHTGTNFACGICNSFFDNEERAKKHIYSHNKKYKCDLCDQKFALRKSLAAHVRAKHPKLSSKTNPSFGIKKEQIIKDNEDSD